MTTTVPPARKSEVRTGIVGVVDTKVNKIIFLFFYILKKPTKQLYQAVESDDEDTGIEIVTNTAGQASESIAATLDHIVNQLAMVSYRIVEIFICIL